MKLSDFKKLEESIQEQDFSKSFSNINRVMFYLSIFGHMASIFLAYFMVSKILSGAITDNPILVGVSTVILLGGLELLKREIFDKFSLQQIKHGSVKNKDVMPLMLISVVIVSMSFYASVRGAKEFSSKSKQIDVQIQSDVKRYEDSVNAVYVERIGKSQNRIDENDRKFDEKDKEMTLKSSSTLKEDKKRVQDLKTQMSQIKDDNVEIKKEIDNLKKENLQAISDYEAKIKTEGEGKKDENKNNSFFFVMISTLIELVILVGVYFNEYYKYRSYLEIKDRIESDPMYQKWFYCNSIINIMYTDDTKINDKLPSIKSMIDLCKINSVILLPKDVTDILKLFSSLGIIRGTSTKYFNKSRESAQETLRKHFKIDA